MAGKVFSDIYTQSARDTGDTTASHIVYVKKKVNDGLRDICAEMNYAWLQRTVSLPLIASQQSYAMSVAADWDEDTPVKIFYRDAAQKRSYIDNLDDGEWSSVESLREGTPVAFNINKKSGAWKAYLSLVPNSGFISQYSPATMEYQKYPTELSADGDIPELPTSHHQALVYWTNGLICLEMGDNVSARDWFAMANQSLGLMKKKQGNRVGRPKRAYPRSYLGNRARSANRKDYNF